MPQCPPFVLLRPIRGASSSHLRVQLLLGLVLGVLSPAVDSAQGIRISELMYHPGGTNYLEQWIELHNPGSQSVDLSGWRLERAVRFDFPTNTVVAPGAFLVVGADPATFVTGHPGAARPLGAWDGTLSHDGDELRLVDAAGRTVDRVAYAPEGDWAVRRIGPPDSLKRQGWEWYAEHAGLGMSLELRNERLPGTSGQNWGSSQSVGGTPGAANSVASTNLAPLVLEVAHSPAIPRSADPVFVAASLVDEASTGLSLVLHWRLDGAPGFTAVPMFDDGAHGDGLPGDGRFGALLPPQPDGSLVEFYLMARDREDRSRTYPNVEPSGNARTANLVYQVDNAEYAGDQPVFRILLPQAELDYLTTQIWGGEPRSDALVSGTWVSTDGVLDGGATTHIRYQCGFRNRGHGTRTAVPHNFHVAFPGDHPWKNRSALNLNTHYTHSQHLGSAVFRRLGIPIPDSRPVQLRLNGANPAKPGQEQFGSYAANEVTDDRLVQRQFPLDPDGNLYRGVRDMIPGINSTADLSWQGPSYTAYTNAYAKENHAALADWSDLLHLIDVLNHTPDSEYAGAVSNVVDVDQWMKYFAVNTLLGNQENSLANGSGDDFSLYRGAGDTRFRLLPYDLDSLLGRGTRTTSYADGLWRMTNVPAIDRFMKRPEFVPAYYRHLQSLAETAFSPAQMNPLLDHLLGGYVDPVAIANMKAFNSNHVDYVLARIPRALAVQPDLPTVGGQPRTDAALVPLRGAADAITTRRLLVNGSEAEWSAWQASWNHPAVPLHPGLNRILIQALGEAGQEVARLTHEIWFDDGSVVTAPASIASDTTWTAAAGPYLVPASLTIGAGATLTIEPGTSVYLGAGVNLTVANGGRLLAEGTPTAPIRFASPPASTTRWGGLVLLGGTGSPETLIRHAYFDGNSSTAIHATAATVRLEHLGFGSTDEPYLSLDGSSFLVADCVFPDPTSAFEPVHGTGGVKSGGHGIFLRNLFGIPIGYNDVIDFTGGQRRNQPIVQFIDNVFLGATDDQLDLDGTDAWVEGNLFLHVHKNGTPDSASAVSGGSSGGDISAVTLIGNLFYDCDQAVTAKQGNYYTLLHNTIVRQTRQGGLDTDAAVVNLADDGTSEGAGLYLEGNIVFDAEKLTRNLTSAAVVFTNNLLPFAWSGPGGANSTADPLFVHLPRLEETAFTTFEQAQILRHWLALRPGSPGRGAGPNGRDLGGVGPLGVSVSGEPESPVPSASVTLQVGLVRSGQGIPSSHWPDGSGYTHYRYRLDGGPWSPAQPTTAPLELSNLGPGPHQVEVAGRRDSGLDQDAVLLGATASVTLSRSWTVDPNATPTHPPTVQLSEILARNQPLPDGSGNGPDLIELHNFGAVPVDLSGFGLTDDAGVPHRFVFAPGTTLSAGGFLVIAAGANTASPGLSTGFALDQAGERVLLFDRAERGGALLDEVEFGTQVAGLSLGRLGDGTWGLCQPTFGSPNLALRLGDPANLRLNEWLADAQFVARHDFVELYNTDPLPVALGGLRLSDAAGSPARHVLPPLSFVGGHGFVEWIADGDPGAGPDHLAFKLAPDVGVLLLSAADGTSIDAVNYESQRTDVSSGRTPNGGSNLTSFPLPTPGAGNPGAAPGDCTLATTTVSLVALGSPWKYQQTANLDGTSWQLPDYDDSAWPSGPALLAVENSPLPGPGKQTTLTLGRTTYYFRTRFVANTNLADFHLNLTLVVDDGAVVYLNGTRILAVGITSNAPPYATFASRNVDNASTEFFTVPASALRPGTNVLAAEVHQINAASSDIVWGLGLDASRTFTNCTPGTALAVVLNEIRASSDPTQDPASAPSASDFVEVLNPGAAPVDLSGMSLTDDSRFPRKWTFPDGSLLDAGARRTITCLGGQPASSTNTGFGLASRGGAVFLFHRPDAGGSLVDALRYGLQASGFSVGRIPDGTGGWNLALPTPDAPNSAAGLASVSVLRLNEWMADPTSGSDWLELHNTATQPVPLGGLFLTDDLARPDQSPIAPLSFLGTGPDAYRRFVADSSPGAGADHVTFALRRSGEALGLFSPSGVMLDGLEFGLQATGVSQGRFPDGAPAFTDFAVTASPGEANHLPLPAPVINEVLTHTDPPLEDALELHNPTASPIDLGGWFLSNSRTTPKKFRIPDGTVIPAGGFVVFYEAQFNSGPLAFTFNAAHGDTAVLSPADAAGQLTGYRDEVEFGAALNGIPFGRHATSIGPRFTALAARTFGPDQPATIDDFRTGTGLPNAAPRVGPVVVSEIHYHPTSGGSESPDDEFIELLNAGSQTVPLHNPAAPTNTWSLRQAVEFSFPTGLTLPAGQRLLVVGFATSDPARLAAFRTRLAVPPEVPVVGPWSGRLANDGDSVDLFQPDAVQLPPHPDAGFVPQVLVDRVQYASEAPWPAAANGAGDSLQRRDTLAFGDEPANWRAAPPTAGRPNANDPADPDLDHDGLPDAWEQLHFGSLDRDGSGDADGDGSVDRDEFQAGTDPNNPADVLRFLSVSGPAPVTLRFQAAAGRSYQVQATDSLAGGPWSLVAEIPVQAAAGPVGVTDPGPAPVARYYRVVSPGAPSR